MGLGIQPLKNKILLGSNPLKPITLVRRLAVLIPTTSVCSASSNQAPHKHRESKSYVQRRGANIMKQMNRARSVPMTVGMMMKRIWPPMRRRTTS